MKKVLYCIRHGYALHNKLYKEFGVKAYQDYRDTNLLMEGRLQALKTYKEWHNRTNVDIVISSPSYRTLETASIIFPNKFIIALDSLLEYPSGGKQICNRRMNLTDLEKIFPNVYFGNIQINEMAWTGKDETESCLDKRINQTMNWISMREEKTIAIVGHSSYLGRFKDGIIGDEDNELKHCFPYKINATF